MTRTELAVKKFTDGYNCAQAVLCAYCDKFGMDEVAAFKLTEGFGLGMGGYKDECGAVTGMFMTIGLQNSDGLLQGSATKLNTYEKLKAAGEAFAEENGSIMCRDLIGKGKALKEAATPEEIAAARGKNLMCVKCVRSAAEYLEKNIVK